MGPNSPLLLKERGVDSILGGQSQDNAVTGNSWNKGSSFVQQNVKQNSQKETFYEADTTKHSFVHLSGEKKLAKNSVLNHNSQDCQPLIVEEKDTSSFDNSIDRVNRKITKLNTQSLVGFRKSKSSEDMLATFNSASNKSNQHTSTKVVVLEQNDSNNKMQNSSRFELV